MTEQHSIFSKLSACLVLLFFLSPFSGLWAQHNKSLQHAEELLRKNKIDAAIVILNNEIKEATFTVDKGLASLQLGDAYKQKQDYTKSLAAFRKALQLFKTQNATPEIFLTYTGIAELYRYQRLYENSEEYLKRCEEMLKRENIADAYLLKFYNRKAALFAEYRKNQDSALLYSEKSMALAQKTGDKAALLVSLMEISGIYERKQNYTQAITLSRETLTIAREQDDIQLQCDAWVNLCRNLNFNGNYSESIKTSLEGFTFAGKHKKDFNQLLLADNLQVAYSKIDDYKNAHKYLRIRLDLTEDFYDKLYDEKVLEYEKKFRLAEKQKQIDDNTKQLLLKEEELKRQRMIRYFILLVMLAVVVFAGILVYKTRIIRKKNVELRLASEENEFLVSESHHRINNNLQLISILIGNELKKNPHNDEFSNRRIIAKIDSLGILHRHLYKKGDGKSIDLNGFLMDVWKNAEVLFAANAVKSSFDVAGIIIPENKAMYMGLLVTELSINSLKHAFEDGDNKHIALHITRDEERIYFSYSDNGKGSETIPKLSLVDKLCRQLRVSYTTETASGFNFNFDMNI